MYQEAEVVEIRFPTSKPTLNVRAHTIMPQIAVRMPSIPNVLFTAEYGASSITEILVREPKGRKEQIAAAVSRKTDTCAIYCLRRVEMITGVRERFLRGRGSPSFCKSRGSGNRKN